MEENWSLVEMILNNTNSSLLRIIKLSNQRDLLMASLDHNPIRSNEGCILENLLTNFFTLSKHIPFQLRSHSKIANEQWILIKMLE